MTEKTYWSRKVAEDLGIGTSSLRRWCLMLEREGYVFLRDEFERRAFTEHDLNALKYFSELLKQKDLRIVDISIKVVEKYNRQSVCAHTEVKEKTLSAHSEKHQEGTEENAETVYAQTSDEEALSAQITKSLTVQSELMEKVLVLTDQMEQQQAFNKALIERLDQKDRYIEESLKDRDSRLLEVIREIQETRKKLASSSEEKNPWYKKLFKW